MALRLIALLLMECTAVVLARGLLHRCTGYRRWNALPRAVLAYAMGAGCGLLAHLASTLHEWVSLHGWSSGGICPGGPLDQPPSLCSVSEFLVGGSRLGIYIYALPWMICWCGPWALLEVYSPRVREPTSPGRYRRHTGAAGAGAAIAAVAAAALATPFLLALCGSPLLRWLHEHVSTREIALDDYRRAWGLLAIERDGPVQPGALGVVKVNRGFSRDTTHLFDSRVDLKRLLQRWPKRCWHAPSEIPAGITSPREAPVPKLWGQPLPQQNIEQGVVWLLAGRWAAPGEGPEQARWARSFEQMSAHVAAGDLAWQWLSIMVSEHDGATLHHLGLEADTRGWRPVCESKGEAYDSMLAHVLRWRLSGEVRSLAINPLTKDRDGVPDAKVFFASQRGERVGPVSSDERGRYQVSLVPGRYELVVEHPAYPPYRHAELFQVVKDRGFAPTVYLPR